MDLHGIASGAIGTVNPFEDVTLKISSGWTQLPTGGQKPRYVSPAPTRNAQLQPLQGNDLKQLDGLNINGTKLKGWFYGEVDAIVRMLNKGGDLVIRADGTSWKVVFVFEQWPDFCSVCLVLQDGQ